MVTVDSRHKDLRYSLDEQIEWLKEQIELVKKGLKDNPRSSPLHAAAGGLAEKRLIGMEEELKQLEEKKKMKVGVLGNRRNVRNFI